MCPRIYTKLSIKHCKTKYSHSVWIYFITSTQTNIVFLNEYYPIEIFQLFFLQISQIFK